MYQACTTDEAAEERTTTDLEAYANAKPGVRWWWFATEIKEEDIRYQLDRIKSKNFGGVEIAWVYPLYRYQRMYARKYDRHYPKDTSAQEWLSEEWISKVSYTKKYADSLGLFCDFTFGSAWPVASSNIDPEQSTKVYGDSSFRQTLTFAWSWPDTLLVIDHLDSNAFKSFAEPIAKALKKPLQGSPSALFTDSWEIKLNAKQKIWTRGFDSLFEESFGYDIIPYMDQGLDSFPDVRYDYLLMLDKLVRENFYEPYVEKCRELGAISRVQCLASPTDVMTTYSLVDVPETENMLNNPNYSLIVSSAACLASKPIISSESFTCTYGFPATYLREEQVADLKMIADAMFSFGVNQHIYHGLPYNPKGVDSIDFFATTYFGPNGSLDPYLADFNQYIQKVSHLMRSGKTYSDLAVYIPFEDGIMKGAYPKAKQRVWVWGQYEMRYIELAEETKGYHPLWINRYFLEKAIWEEGELRVGDASFSALYIDVEYMDVRALERVYELAVKGLAVCLKQSPAQPGFKKSADFQARLAKLKNLKNVSKDIRQVVDHPALIEGDSLPQYWAKQQEDGSLIVFLAQPKSQSLSYPIYSGQSFMKRSITKRLVFNYGDKQIEKELEFLPYQSIALKISLDGEIEMIDIAYFPPEPEVKPKEVQKSYF